MKKIFWGFLLLFFNFEINLGEATIGLIPDFLGYIFLLKGIDELSRETTYFVKYRTYAILLTVYSVIEYVADITGVHISSVTGDMVGSEEWLLASVIGVAVMIMHLILVKGIVNGVSELEKKYNTDFQSLSLISVWNVTMWLHIISYVASIFIPEMLELIFVLVIAQFVAHIVFLVKFNVSKNLYEIAYDEAYAGRTVEGFMEQ